MINLIKLNYKYIFNKTTITISLLFIMFLQFGLIYSTGIFDGYYQIDMYRVEYQLSYINDSVLLIKVVLIMMAIFIATLANGEGSNNLAKYIVDKSIKKYSFIFARIFTLFLVMSVILILFCLSFVAISKIITPFTIDNSYIYTIFQALLLQTFFYISFTSLLLTILPSLLTSLLPVLIFWYMEVNNTKSIIESSSIIKGIYQNIPNVVFSDNCYSLLFPIENYIAFILIVILLNIFIYVKKDIS
ncbi:hypothetical protein RJI07_00465 [Mycoplasmatota bacterium WC30]